MLVHKALIPTDLSDDELKSVTDIVTILTTATGFVMQCPSLSLYWQFDLNRVDYGNDIMYLCRDRFRQWVVVWATDINEAKDSWSAVMMRKNIDEFRPIVMVGVSPDKKDYTAIFFCHTREPNNEAPTVDTKTESGDMTMKRLMPSIEPLLQRHWAKYKLLKNVKTNDSLAALEAQVDLLTHWLVSLLPADKVQKLLDVGVLTLKDEQTVLANVVAFKKTLREHQQLYLTTIGK